MVKKCSFCRGQIADESAFEVCQKCGYSIWGEKMFKAIRDNMEKAKQEGDLYQGSVTEDQHFRKAA